MNTDLTPEEDLIVKHRRGEPGFYMRPEVQAVNQHFHYQYELLLCCGGTAEFSIAGKSYTMQPGTFLFISNMENHFIYSHDEAFDRYAVRFSPRTAEMMRSPLLLSLFRQRPADFCHAYRCREEDLPFFQGLFRNMLLEYRGQKPCWSQIITSTLLILLSVIYRSSPQSFPASIHPEGQMLIFRVQSYLENHLSEDLSLDTVASRFYVDKFHLSHQFSRFTGYTFKQYITSARLAMAKDLLLHTNTEVRQIAEQVGYNSSTHFIRVFKDAEGISPLQYRVRQRQM